ncbi:MAG: GFA family protein [Pseudomonadota bacterium]
MAKSTAGNQTDSNLISAFTGGCLCEAHRYEIHRCKLNAMHCYCLMCRKAHGAAFSTHVIVPPKQLVWLSDRNTLMARESSHGAYREFCGTCGTHLLVHGQSGDGTYAIPAGTLNGNPPLNLLGHMYTQALVPWHTITDELPQYEKWPPGYGPDQ